MEYIAPKYRLDAFNCPHCNAYAKQMWKDCITGVKQIYNQPDIEKEILHKFEACHCQRCKKFMLWHFGKMVYPLISISPISAEDMPDSCIDDYNEARNIFAISPKAAAALLRLVLQKLCVKLGEKGKNINDDIANLVKKGLSPGVQKALDVVRVVGNNAVHPGEINIDDNPEIAFKLFKLINIIVENMITRPKEIDELYAEIPDEIRKSIEKRDKTESD